MSFIIVLLAIISFAVASCQSVVGGGNDVAQGIQGQYTFNGPGVFMDCSNVPPEEVAACEEFNKPFSEPIADASIEVRDSENNLLAQTVTDFDGNFKVELPPGEYLLCADFCEGLLTVKAGEFVTYNLAIYAP